MRVDLILVVEYAGFEQNFSFIGKVFEDHAIDSFREFHHRIGVVPGDGIGLEPIVIATVLQLFHCHHVAPWLVSSSPKVVAVFLALHLHELLQQILEFHLCHFQARRVQTLVYSGQIEEVCYIVLSVFVGDEIPERMSCKLGLFKCELVEGSVFT